MVEVSVKRFSLFSTLDDSGLESDPNGNWVRFKDHEAECAALRAEVERLNGLMARHSANFTQLRGRCRAAESSLAAANELLRWLASELQGAYRGQINAFLSAQPAAPKFVCGKCGFSTSDGSDVEEWQCPECGACVDRAQSAAQSDAQPRCDGPLDTCPECHVSSWPASVVKHDAECSRAKPAAPSIDAQVCGECGERTAFDAPGFVHKPTCSEVTGQPVTPEHTHGCAWYVDGPCTRGCAQSAAPARTETDELESTEHRTACRYEKEFPSLDASDCPVCSRPPTFIGVDCSADAPKELREFARRTEAEQRVLDAMGLIPDGTIHWMLNEGEVSPTVRAALEAERARRQR